MGNFTQRTRRAQRALRRALWTATLRENVELFEVSERLEDARELSEDDVAVVLVFD
jgi:hypothetical protein